MANGLQLNESTPVAGLGTFSYTATSTGLYTLEFKSFLPYQPSGSQPQSTVSAAEVTDITFAADTAGNKNDTYINLFSSGDAYQFYLWFNINAAGTDPAIANKTGIEVAGATGATAATLATAAIAAINAHAVASLYMKAVAGASGHAIVSNRQLGAASNAANGLVSAGASFSVTTAGSYGVPAQSGLTAKIFNNDVLVGTYGLPSPTQPLIGGQVSMQVTSGNDIDIIFASLSDADAALNAVKSVVNLYQGS